MIETIRKKIVPISAACAVLAVTFLLQWKLSKPSGTPHPPMEASGSASGGDMAAGGGAAPDLDLPGLSPANHDLKALEAELKKKPNHGPILLKMAEVARSTGKPAEAIGYLRQLTAAEPKNAEGRLELGRALFETGDVDGAIAETTAAVELAPKDTDALYNLGAIYGNLGKDDEARKYWQRAVAAGPETPSAKRAKESLAKLKAI